MSNHPVRGPVRRSLLVALAVLTATVGLGAAVRMAQSAAPARLPAGSAPLSFEARSNGPIHFGGRLDRGAVLGNGDGIVSMELSLRADASSGAGKLRVPTDLVVVLDRSGSMSGEKLSAARAAIRALLDRLGPQDRFALVTYSDAAELRLPLAAATDGARSAWLAAVEGISADGGTNMAAGLDLGLGTVDGARGAGRSPRVILISDGLANQGDVSREGLRGRAVRAARGEYALSTVGVGADFDEELMASLADAGTGNFHYLENAVNLSEIFASELATARETVAQAVAIQIAPAPGVELLEAAGYPIERDGGVLRIRPGSLFAGQDRRVWLTLRVPTTGPASQSLGEFSLAYRVGDLLTQIAFPEAPRITRVAKAEDFYAHVDRDGWSEAVVVDQYNRLQREVAADLKDGNAPKAQERISSYGRSVGEMNARVGSSQVAQKLEEVKRLADVVNQAAAAPASERALTAKELQAEAVHAARPGALK